MFLLVSATSFCYLLLLILPVLVPFFIKSYGFHISFQKLFHLFQHKLLPDFMCLLLFHHVQQYFLPLVYLFHNVIAASDPSQEATSFFILFISSIEKIFLLLFLHRSHPLRMQATKNLFPFLWLLVYTYQWSFNLQRP